MGVFGIDCPGFTVVSAAFPHATIVSHCGGVVWLGRGCLFADNWLLLGPDLLFPLFELSFTLLFFPLFTFALSPFRLACIFFFAVV